MFRGGGGPAALKNADRNISHAGTANVGLCPSFQCVVVEPRIYAYCLYRFAEEIAADQIDHVAVTSAVAAQINYQGFRIGEETHHGDRRVAGVLGILEVVQLQVADVSGQALDPPESVVVITQSLEPFCLLQLRHSFFHVCRIERPHADMKIFGD